MLVLLDIDGTLVDTNYLHVDAWARAFHELGLVIPRAAIHRQIGKGSDQFLPQFVEDEPSRKLAAALHPRFYNDVRSYGFALPGARSLIDALAAAHHSMWIATSAKPEELRERLQLLGVDEKRFDGVVSAGDVKRSKPHPDIFLEVLRRAKARPGGAIVVGDTIWDVQAARSAGVRALAVLTGGAFSAAELKDAGAEAIFDDCADLRMRGLSLLR